MRDGVKPSLPAWYTTGAKAERTSLTPGQVQRSALGYLVQLGTPAKNTRKAGKGKGRTKGYQPPPRKRFPVIKKAKNPPNKASTVT